MMIHHCIERPRVTQVLVTPPTVLAVDLATAKLNMRIDGTDMDALVTSWIEGVTSTMENEIGQCMVDQGWQVVTDGFADRIPLPHPASEILSITYLDAAGDEQQLAPALCKIVRKRYDSALVLAADAAWPVTAVDEAAVTISVKCGYGPTADTTPAALKLYILGKLVEQFDPISATMRDLTTDTVQSKNLERLLDQFRSYA